MGNPFFGTPFFGTKRSTAFVFDPGPREVPEPENTQIRVFVYFMERFVPKNGVPKNGFPIVFSKSDLAGGGLFLSRKKILKKPNFLECAQVLLVTWVKLNSINTHLSTPPSTGLKLLLAKAGKLYRGNLINGK